LGGKSEIPMFLIHDSILFADVDERQKALALELAAKESEKRHFNISAHSTQMNPHQRFQQGV